MQPIIYDVAVSADGFIAGPDADISKFPHNGSAVDGYFERLETYRSVIMGRATYEFGYGYGLTPGANPYPHMTCFVFSRTIELPSGADVTVVRGYDIRRIDELQRSADGPIYLCGGGVFAGWLMSLGRIDILRLKRASILLGDGTRLFGDYTGGVNTELVSSDLEDNGVAYQELRVVK
ncbi:dihydrofolate reductase family protein [Bauldia sp.]|uniref:dihydrofolate reductase family protein n=1 Tax=Bauldia sp. TaxID=2575872 RepID=UPI003BA9E99F